MSDYNGPYQSDILTDISNDKVYSTVINYEVNIGESREVFFSGEVYDKYGTVIYPVRANYNSSKIDMEACENDKFTPYPIKYELLYQSNGKYIKIDEVTTSTGKASFKNLIKDYTYYIKAIDLSGKYLSKVVKYIPTEYDLSAQPTILIPYANYSYDKFQYNFIITNIIGEKYVYLENNNNHIKLEKIDDKRYIISLSEIKNRADEFDLVLEDYRENEIIKKVERIYINDGFSEAYDFSIEFLDNGSAIFKWRADGTIDYVNVYLDSNKISEPIIGTGLKTYIANNYEFNKTQYFKIGTKRNEKEKFSEILKIDGIETNFENIDILIEAEANRPIKNTSINSRNPVIYGSPVILTTPGINDSGELYLNGSSGIYFNVEPLNNKDFTIEMYFSLNSLSRDSDRLFEFSNGNTYAMTIAMWANTSKPYLAIKRNNTWTNYGLDKITVELGKYYHYVIMRKNNIFYYFIDGILIETIEDTATLNYPDLYFGQTSSGSARIIGKYNTIKFIIDKANYNIAGFESKTILKKTKITPPNITYDITSNNSINLYLDHQNNNIDNYSVYLFENENIELTNNFLITKEKSKSIKIENFDVYNNYDKNYKLIVTSNRYNHEYPSEVKDVYMGYNWWTKDEVKPLLWFDASDESTIITNSNNEVTTFLDKSGNNFHAYKTENIKAPIYNSTTKCISNFGNTNERIDLAGKFINVAETSDYTIFIVAKGYKNTTNTIGQEGSGVNFYVYSNLVSPIFQITSTKSDNSSGNYIIPLISLTTNRLTMTETKNSLAPFNISFPHNYTDKVLITIKRNSGNIFYSLMGNTYSTGAGTLTYKVDFEKFHLFDSYDQGFSNNDLHELIMVKSFIDDETCNKIQADLSLKWGLNNYLPENHISKKYKDYNNGIIDHTPSFTYQILEDE